MCFYSSTLEKSTPYINSPKVVNRILNKNEINKIILFDHLIFNEDRHNGNILLQSLKGTGGFYMYIIDHSHIFNLRHAWDMKKLEKLINDEDYKDERVMKLNLDSLYNLFFELDLIDEDILKDEAIKFKECITEEKLKDIIQLIPSEWNILQKRFKGIS
ncbi:MAG: hypothetical protein ACRC7N_12685 [Clostridium sp.]